MGLWYHKYRPQLVRGYVNLPVTFISDVKPIGLARTSATLNDLKAEIEAMVESPLA